MQPDLDAWVWISSRIFVLHATLPESGHRTREDRCRWPAIKAEDEHVTSVARNLLRATLFRRPIPTRCAPSGSARSGRLAWIARQLARPAASEYLVGQQRRRWPFLAMCRRGRGAPASGGTAGAASLPGRCNSRLCRTAAAGWLSAEAQTVEQVRGQRTGGTDDRLPWRHGFRAKTRYRLGIEVDRRGQQRPGIALFHPHPGGTRAGVFCWLVADARVWPPACLHFTWEPIR